MAIKGIDVSRFQEDINFNAVKASGVELVILRCGGSDWWNKNANPPRWEQYDDVRFEENYRKAKAAGLKVGAYYLLGAHFDAQTQVNHMWSFLEGKDLDVPPILDIEGDEQSSIGAGALTDLAGYILASLHTITGIKPIIYAGEYFTNSYLQGLKQYPLWVASYSHAPNCNGFSIIGWQYSSTGSVPGVNGNCDLNEFYEGILNKGTTPSKPIKIENDYIGVIKAGAVFGLGNGEQWARKLIDTNVVNDYNNKTLIVRDHRLIDGSDEVLLSWLENGSYNNGNIWVPINCVDFYVRYAIIGTYVFNTEVQIRNKPCNVAGVGASYFPNEEVNYHHVIENKEGFDWLEYTRNNGQLGYMKYHDRNNGEYYGYIK